MKVPVFWDIRREDWCIDTNVSEEIAAEVFQSESKKSGLFMDYSED
jgi:hypothetical protein